MTETNYGNLIKQNEKHIITKILTLIDTSKAM